MSVRRTAVGLLLLAASAWIPAASGDPAERGGFPVREPDDDTPFYVLYNALKAGVEEDEAKGLKLYLDLCPEDRKTAPEKLQELKSGEWSSLREHAGAYLAYDLHGFKVFVIKMSPGDVTQKTKKIYFTIKNQIEPDDRSGLCIVERDSKGRWKLRSMAL